MLSCNNSGHVAFRGFKRKQSQRRTVHFCSELIDCSAVAMAFTPRGCLLWAGVVICVVQQSSHIFFSGEDSEEISCPQIRTDFHRLQKYSLESVKIILNLWTRLFSLVAAKPRWAFVVGCSIWLCMAMPPGAKACPEHWVHLAQGNRIWPHSGTSVLLAASAVWARPRFFRSNAISLSRCHIPCGKPWALGN